MVDDVSQINSIENLNENILNKNNNFPRVDEREIFNLSETKNSSEVILLGSSKNFDEESLAPIERHQNCIQYPVASAQFSRTEENQIANNQQIPENRITLW